LLTDSKDSTTSRTDTDIFPSFGFAPRFIAHRFMFFYTL
jgi:hypothetical protein